MTLFEAMLTAPVVATSQARERVLHAVGVEGLVASWGVRRTVDAVCGTTRLKLLSTGEQEHPVPWPPRVSTVPDGTWRCVDCHELTGRKRPRSEYHKVYA